MTPTKRANSSRHRCQHLYTKRKKTLIGKTVGKYRIVEHLGRGGMAEVYKAHHPTLDRYVAIKVLHSFLADEEDFLTRFRREAKIVATFRHPNIVQVYDFDQDDASSNYFMVMEYVDGPTLKTRLRELTQEGRTLPLEEAVRIALALALALDYAHQQGMVHRDIKPANVIFTQKGQVILTDFGIAKMVNTSTLTASGAMVGTPAYMAPEQGMGQVGDERSDIYSLGAVLYQLVTGSLPYDADTPLGTVLKHINSPLTPPANLVPSLPPNIEAVIIRSLAKDPDNRYQTAKEFINDLQRAVAGKSVAGISTELAMSPAASLTITTTGAIPRARTRRGWFPVFATIVIIILLGIVALYATGLSDRLLATLFPQTPTPAPSATAPPEIEPTPDLAATFDFLSTQVANGVDSALSTRDALAIYEATLNAPTPTIPPTATPDLTATALAACLFDMAITEEQGVQSDIFMPGQQVIKRWTIQNTGTCAWPNDTDLVFVSGDEPVALMQSSIGTLAPGDTLEIQLTLQAPERLDSYTSVWQLQDGEENSIGEALEITFVVAPTPTLRPPTDTPTPEFTATPSEPLWMSIPGVVECQSGARGRTGWGWGGGPSDEYRYFLGRISPETELPGANNDFTGFPHVATYFTTSGEFTLPVPEDCCPGDVGRYTDPQGYEIVWQKVWLPETSCPEQ